MTNVYTLAVWGNSNVGVSWNEWFQFMNDASVLLGAPLTHIGISGDGLGTKKVRPIAKYKRIQSKMDASTVEWFEGFSLPEDFETAAFDYNVYMNRSSSYISICVKEKFASSLLKGPDTWKLKLTRFCSITKGVLFEMDESESPLFFVSGASPQDSFDSLVVLKELR